MVRSRLLPALRGLVRGPLLRFAKGRREPCIGCNLPPVCESAEEPFAVQNRCELGANATWLKESGMTGLFGAISRFRLKQGVTFSLDFLDLTENKLQAI
jgi:hypothetical protein